MKKNVRLHPSCYPESKLLFDKEFHNGESHLYILSKIKKFGNIKRFFCYVGKVQFFWEGHKKFGVIFDLFWHLLSKSADLSKQLEDNCEILWSSQLVVLVNFNFRNSNSTCQ